jgi:hypothetical protein
MIRISVLPDYIQFDYGARSLIIKTQAGARTVYLGDRAPLPDLSLDGGGLARAGRAGNAVVGTTHTHRPRVEMQEMRQ